MLRRLILSAGAATGAIWAYKKYTYYDLETRESLRAALNAGRLGDRTESERCLHQALHSATNKYGPHSVNYMKT